MNLGGLSAKFLTSSMMTCSAGLEAAFLKSETLPHSMVAWTQ